MDVFQIQKTGYWTYVIILPIWTTVNIILLLRDSKDENIKL